ncbi:AAA domain-containing protein [Pisolithus croceorrhizus]|nr:AAA domain-containing protein [Pisolithus croceorrhizus]
MPSAIGDFISQKVYNGKLKTCHANTITLPCRFVHVERGREVRSGKSWVNPSEARVVVQIARAYQAEGLDFRIITPYDAQRSLIERELQAANICHEDKVFNVDSFQGNEAEHIVISVVRSDKLGFLANQRRTNVMLTRCKKTMDICTSRAFISGPAASTLIGQLAVALGPQAWIDGDVQPITLPQAVIPPPPNTPLTAPAHHLSTFTIVAGRGTRDGHTPASSPAPPLIDPSMDSSNVVLPPTQVGEMRTSFESLALQDLEHRESLIDHCGFTFCALVILHFALSAPCVSRLVLFALRTLSLCIWYCILFAFRTWYFCIWYFLLLLFLPWVILLYFVLCTLAFCMFCFCVSCFVLLTSSVN